jgi:hypothetical protein
MTSPPYWALRDYGTKWQLGLEADFREYIFKLVQVFDELKRVLKRTGSFYLNMGDTYSGGGSHSKLGGVETWGKLHGMKQGFPDKSPQASITNVIPAKSMIGIPWRVALELMQDDRDDIYELRKGLSKQERNEVLNSFNYLNSRDPSVIMSSQESTLRLAKRDIAQDLLKYFRPVKPHRWILRNDIIWHKCLGANVPVYARSQGSLLRTTVRELARLPLNDLWLPGREGWRKVIRIQRQQEARLLTIHLRNGTRIEVTPDHRFPLQGELVEAKLLKKGDRLYSCTLPSNEGTSLGTYENGWVIGLFIAEGSYETNRNAFRFSLHAKESHLSNQVQRFALNYAGTFREHNYSNWKAAIISGKIPTAIIRHYVACKGAKHKHLSRNAFNESNYFLHGLLDGFLAGDGHYDEKNDRWRFRITANRELEYDLKTIVNRLGFFMRSRYRKTKARGIEYPGIEIEIRKRRAGHPNQKDDYEVMRIERTRGISYEIEVDSDHLFVLYDGTVTHNSNSMPSSVKDRLSNTYEHIFHFVKSKRYYYNLDAIRIPPKFPAKPFNIRVRHAGKGIRCSCHVACAPSHRTFALSIYT